MSRIPGQEVSITWLENISLPFSRSRAARYLREYSALSFERDKLDVSLVMQGDRIQFPDKFVASLDEKITTLGELQDKVLSNNQKMAKSVHRRLQKLVDHEKTILSIQGKNEELDELKSSLTEMQAAMDRLQS